MIHRARRVSAAFPRRRGMLVPRFRGRTGAADVSAVEPTASDVVTVAPGQDAGGTRPAAGSTDPDAAGTRPGIVVAGRPDVGAPGPDAAAAPTPAGPPGPTRGDASSIDYAFLHVRATLGHPVF